MLIAGDCECHSKMVKCHGYFDEIDMKYACPHNDVITSLIIYNPLVSQSLSLRISKSLSQIISKNNRSFRILLSVMCK
jgi:hypothetical protein